MKSTITNAAEITILEPIDNNYKTGAETFRSAARSWWPARDARSCP